MLAVDSVTVWAINHPDQETSIQIKKPNMVSTPPAIAPLSSIHHLGGYTVPSLNNRDEYNWPYYLYKQSVPSCSPLVVQLFIIHSDHYMFRGVNNCSLSVILWWAPGSLKAQSVPAMLLWAFHCVTFGKYMNPFIYCVSSIQWDLQLLKDSFWLLGELPVLLCLLLR